MKKRQRWQDAGICVANTLKKSVVFAVKNPRYIGVAILFVLALWYNFFVAIAPEETDTSSQDNAVVVQASIIADLEKDQPSKLYERMLLSRAGDWYRIGVVAQALDEDESLSIFLVSSLGEKQEVGQVNIVKSERERFFEFIIETNGEYEDVLLEKQIQDTAEWQGGRVRLEHVFVSRLSVRNAYEAKALQPTVFGERDMQIFATGKPSVQPVFAKKSPHFIAGQVLTSADDAFVHTIRLRFATNSITATGKYRLEVHTYNEQTGEVGKDVLVRTAFSVKSLKKMVDIDGSFRIPIALNMDTGQSYFVGVSDDYVKKGPRITLESFQDETTSETALFHLEAIHRGTSERDILLSHAVVEDTGKAFQYHYQSLHTEMDVMDIYTSKGSIDFNEDAHAVTVEKKSGNFFTYRINMLRPFSLARVQVMQFGKADDAVVEYSLDNVSWKKISAKDITDDKEAVFDEILLPDEQNSHSVVYLRLSYAGEKDASGAVGFSDMRITARLNQ